MRAFLGCSFAATLPPTDNSGKLSVRCFFSCEAIPSEALADNLTHGEVEALEVLQQCSVLALAVVVAERFDAHVRALQAALQKTPEVFESVGVDVPANVFNRVIDHLVLEFGQAIIRL
jgi:hypothetical protein